MATCLAVREFSWIPLASSAIGRKQTPCVRAATYPVVVMGLRPQNGPLDLTGSDEIQGTIGAPYSESERSVRWMGAAGARSIHERIHFAGITLDKTDSLSTVAPRWTR